MQKTAMISGISGQDGGYLAKFLFEKGYKIFGLYYGNSSDDYLGLKSHGIYEEITFLNFDLLDYSSILKLLDKYQPDEFYNLAAHVASSWKDPVYTMQASGTGVISILEAIRQFSPNTKFFQASTSEMFGTVDEFPQTENTSFCPYTPYGIAKLAAHWMVVNYYKSFGLFACSGILYNHESPMRGKEYVTRKITMHFADVLVNGPCHPLELGYLDAKRDWGFAGDYVKAMWMMLQHQTPETFIIATGKVHTVRNFVEEAGLICGYEIEWHGNGENEIGVDKKSGRVLVKVNPEFYRPAESVLLVGNPEKAKNVLGWSSEYGFKELCHMMMKSDIEQAKNN